MHTKTRAGCAGFLKIPFLALGLSLFCLLLPAVNGLDYEQQEKSLVARFGPSSTTLFREWKKAMADSRNAGEADKLRRVNDFINRHLHFDDDSAIWSQGDYWATPLETLGKGQGDCEDFSIAKYYSLLELGIPLAKLRLVYVRARQNGPAGPVLQAHMVLAYYPTPNADPLVLDNLKGDIRPASARSDLTPIFSFNGAGLWHGTGNQAGKSSLSRWQDLLQRARAEGFQ